MTKGVGATPPQKPRPLARPSAEEERKLKSLAKNAKKVALKLLQTKPMFLTGKPPVIHADTKLPTSSSTKYATEKGKKILPRTSSK